ncbi:CCA tRNA nucleotidyltransferase [Methylocella tundrae]|uniref:tRNA nucleotidyltransferase/poly(A) polymerase n=1 Tax=Methylocella tundrae TaxID=227605 RepID=A0A4U8Z627_METTU|nr:CCA tRNA nucleotidyltransferase [Methylocella tundrae]WPP04613.1 CCA tRNA nucleotidyltransferase [Methylocella tundrae]VFU11047.1 tRNA nucleotidyltransferase/poly(A) polymerase [Methylocella tundrae]
MNGDAPPTDGAASEALAALLRNPSLDRIFEAIDFGGEETRLVGGAVRNALLGRPVHEIDLATTAAPETTAERASAAGIRVIPTGVEHGTLTLLVGGETFEVTSLREDVETDGRRATVRFGRDFRADALRRDFTINALFLAKDGRIFDYVGGLDDIRARRLRFIGEPAQRIREDYLRILRFFRFSADFTEGPLDPAGLVAAMRERSGLARLSRERVRAELLKLLAARRAAEAAQEMCDAGLLGPLIASAPNPARLRRMAATEDAGPPDPLLRLAALCVELPEDADRLGQSLRLSNAERQRLERAARLLIPLHAREAPPGEDELRRLLFLNGRQAAADAVMLAAIRAPDLAQWVPAKHFLRETQEPRLPFSGADLLAHGFARGPAIGEALDLLQTRWIAAGFPDDASVLAQMLDEVVKGSR